MPFSQSAIGCDNLTTNGKQVNLKYGQRKAATDPAIKGRLSEQIGEERARQILEDEMGFELLPHELPGGGKQGQFDLIARDPNTGDIYVVEVKGGSSGLGERLIDGRPYQQGTIDYRNSIIDHMNQVINNNLELDEIEDTLDQINSAISRGKIQYIYIRQPINSNGVLLDPIVKKF